MIISRVNNRRGFSLVEILVAVLLIGILMAVAAPRLLGSREAAGDSASQQQIDLVALAAQTNFVRSENFAGSTAALLVDDVPEVSLVDAAVDSSLVPDTNVRTVSIGVRAGNTEWVAASLGGNGRCWFRKLSATGADQFSFANNATTACSANDAPATGNAAWISYGYPDPEN